jgi:GNAT superfamily N-acetyltransferase
MSERSKFHEDVDAMAESVRALIASDAEACDAIMRGLPEWFGYEPGLRACAEAVRTQNGRVALADGRVAGFAVWEERTPECAEITWAAVDRERRGQGIGTRIVEAVVEDLRALGYRLALVMTSGRAKGEAPYPDSYVPTRAFWRARGFLPMIELDIWETDVALLSVRPIAPPPT